MISEEDTDKYFAEVLDILKEQFEAGDKSKLLHAIHFLCLMNRAYAIVDDDGKVLAEPQFRPMPEWLRIAFLRAYEAATRYEIRSWDDAFGQPHPKGRHLKTEKRNAELRFLILRRVEELKTENTPIDKGLFEQIGEELEPPLKGTTVSEIYYDDRTRKLREMTTSLMETLSPR
jgi:hypothetical protein